MGTPQDPRKRHRQKARRTAKEARLRDKKLNAELLAPQPSALATAAAASK